MNNKTQDRINKMIESGELAVMTECAYGETIADSETDSKINLKNKTICEKDLKEAIK